MLKITQSTPSTLTTTQENVNIKYSLKLHFFRKILSLNVFSVDLKINYLAISRLQAFAINLATKLK